MTALDDFRSANPTYKSWSDPELADAIYRKFYSDMPREEFDKKLGTKSEARPSPPLYLGEGGKALSPEEEAALYARKPTPEPGVMDAMAGAIQADVPLGASHETLGKIPTHTGQALVQTGAIPLDIASRGVGAVVAGGANLVRQGAEALGMDPDMAGRLERDVPMLAESAGIVTGMSPSPAEFMPRGVRPAQAPIAQELAAVVDEVPSTSRLKEMSRANIAKAQEYGLTVSADAFDGFVDSLKAKMGKEGYREFRYPEATKELKYMESKTKRPQTLDDLDDFMQGLTDNLTSNIPKERRMAGIMKSALYDFMDTVPEGSVLSKNPAGALEAFRAHKDLWKRFRKSELIDRTMQKAMDSRSTYTQAGLQTAIQNQFKSLVKNDKKMKQFSADEQLALRRVAQGDLPANVMRYLGGLAPRGIVAGMGDVILGSATGLGPVPFMLMGEGARFGALKMTERNVRLASEMVRKGAREKLSNTVSPAVLDHLEGKLATRKLVNDWVKGFELATKYRTQGATNWLANASRALSAAIASELNVPNMVPRITKELQGINPAQAEPEQPEAVGGGH